MEKALKILLMDRYEIGNPKIVTTEMFNEAISELEEAMKHKTCNGCKFDYDIDNFDSIDGKRLDSFRPNECYICERNMQDRYKQKDNA